MDLTKTTRLPKVKAHNSFFLFRHSYLLANLPFQETLQGGLATRLQAFRCRQVVSGLLLVTLSLGLFGCAQGFDVPTATTGNDGSSRGISPQSVKFDEELLGSERQAALQQALGDWKVQGVESLLESEGKQLELDRAEAFSFERESHQGTLVLLPFGDELLSYLQFRDSSRIMLTAHRPGATLRAVNDAQERKDLLQEMQAKGAFQWLEEEFKRRSRVLMPGLTILLKDDSRQIVVFVVFTQPRQANSSWLTAQLVFLDPGVDGDAAGEIYLGDGTTSSSTAKLDPGRERMAAAPTPEHFKAYCWKMKAQVVPL